MSANLTPKAMREMDLGEYGGAELFLADLDGDGLPEALVYDRRHLWVFRPE